MHPSFETHRIEASGAQLHCETAGSGDPVVLVHSGITDSRMWDAQIEPFSQDHLVVRYDLRGFGRSTIPPAPFAHHDDLFALFGTLGLGPSVVIGASYGGNVAASFAIEHPEAVRALVLVNTLAGMQSPSEGLRAGWRAVNAEMDAGNVEGAVEVETRLWVDGPERSPAEVDPELRDRVTAMNAAIFARMDEQEAAEERELEPPIVERLSEITAPTLVIVGELDQPDALDSADTLVVGIPHARRASIPNAAHLPNMERPETFNRIVAEFIASL
ncbi:MAG: alpha/beta fold hydrolase [Chloroflexota bacterium]|nr:alpha/beta fold hydrolase [Chloroflexota bacterium]